MMETPASELRRDGRAVYFRELGVGEAFESNGNIWTKRSTRTATGIWPACLPDWAYFGQNEVVHVQRNGESAKQAIQRVVNRAIAEGSPVIEEIPALPYCVPGSAWDTWQRAGKAWREANPNGGYYDARVAGHAYATARKYPGIDVDQCTRAFCEGAMHIRLTHTA